MSVASKLRDAVSEFSLFAKQTKMPAQDTTVPNAAEWAAAVHARKNNASQPVASHSDTSNSLVSVFDPQAMKDSDWDRQEHFVLWVLDQVPEHDLGMQSYIGADFDKALAWFDSNIIAKIGSDPSDPDEQQDFLDAVLHLVGDDEQGIDFIGNDVQKALVWYRDYSVYTMGYSPDMDLGYDEPHVAIG